MYEISPSNLTGPVEKIVEYLCRKSFYKVGFHSLIFCYFEVPWHKFLQLGNVSGLNWSSGYHLSF